ncbi:MAG: acyltransferase [Siphonobacter sp.]
MQKQSEYIAQLDGLRTIAIFLVIIFHWLPEGQGINIISNGPLGVTLFFVLSGFLITRILLNNRSSLPSQGFVAIYKIFMARRILRIFPVYFVTLFAVWAVQFFSFFPKIPTLFYSNPLYYIFYLSNFLIEKMHAWWDILSPFWSLAVEEQFYILWPVVMLLTPKRYLKGVILITISLGFISRGLLYFLNLREDVLMPECLDAFGLGALWAYIQFYNDMPAKFVRQCKVLAIIGLIIFVSFCIYGGTPWLYALFFRGSMSFLCLLFVVLASYKRGLENIAGKILSSAVFKYIGKISYGLYVFHMLVPALVVPLLIKIISRFFHINLILTGHLWNAITFLVLLGVASLSWHMLELPFNKLKRFFRIKETTAQSHYMNS